MRFSPSGDFLVSQGERITLTVEAVGGAQLAAFPTRTSCGPWESLEHNGNTTTGIFRAPSVLQATCAAVITFQFTPGPPNSVTSPTSYNVRVEGEPGEITHTESITPPPNAQQIPYIFLVDR